MNRLSQRIVGGGLGLAMKSMAQTFLRDAHHARAGARRTLQEILRLNGPTEWGRTHSLDSADPVAAFQAMPVTSYTDYAPFIERVAAGEQGILTSEPVTYFAVTSGTTGAQKLIPVTSRQTRAIMKNMLTPMGLAMREGLLGPMRGRWLQIMTEQISGTTPGGIPKGAATSGGLQKMGRMTDLFWTSPIEVVRIQDQMTARYLHLLFALSEEHLWSIVAFFPSTLLFTLRDLQSRGHELIRDLFDGRISRGVELEDGLRTALNSRLQANPGRARQLLQLLEHDRFTVREIWPSVGAILTAGSGTFRFYLDQLQPYLGGVPLFSPVYAASEAAIGIGLSPAQPGYLLTTGAAYYEFLPPGASEKPLGLDQVEVGTEYEILLTTYAGLTRYRLGDLVKVIGFHGEAPIIEFLRRQGQIINVVGEKTNEQQVATAFEAACQEAGAAITDYLVAPDASQTPARYLILVEELTHLARTGGNRGELDADALLAAFERQLVRTAPDYGDSRRMGELGAPALVLLRSGAFERYRTVRVAAGASAAQVKVPHAVPDPGFVTRFFQGETLREFVNERVG